jgi:type 1 glutamine amidotransferase
MTNVLYIYGGWRGHSPEEIAQWSVNEMKDLGFDVQVTRDAYALQDDLTGFDLVVLGWNQSCTTELLTVEQENGLLHAVELGTGLAGWHGMIASFQSSVRYHHLIGGTFVAHPGDLFSPSTGLPRDGVTIPSYTVRLADPEHEVSRGVREFEIATEQYYMHVDPNNRVVTETTFSGDQMPWLAGCRMPVAWVRSWGDGRIFASAIGHSPADLEHPDVARLHRQGMTWAARKS